MQFFKGATNKVYKIKLQKFMLQNHDKIRL